MVVAELELDTQKAMGILPGIQDVIGKALVPRPVVRLLYEDVSQVRVIAQGTA